MTDRYKAWQYTNKETTIRVVFESKMPMSLHEMWFSLKDTVLVKGSWEPVPDSDLGAIVTPSDFCNHCGRMNPDTPCVCETHECDDLCAGSCPNDPPVAPDEHVEPHTFCTQCGVENDQSLPKKDICKECDEDARIEHFTEQAHFNEYGGDPNDEATWIGHEPDRRPQI